MAVLVFVRINSHPTPSFAAVQARHQPSDGQLLDRHGQVIHELRIHTNGRRLAWLPLSEVSPALLKTVITAEDKHFYSHWGVDLLALAKSVWDASSGRGGRGASTLSMQLAALLDAKLKPRGGRRSFTQKLAQIRAALALERRWSKAQILEAYVNLVSFRGEWDGVHAASRALLRKAPSGLDESEALMLAALLPSPNAPPSDVAKRACRLAQMQNVNVACDSLTARVRDALTRDHAITPAVALAPHIAQQLLSAQQSRVKSTLDGALQRFVLNTVQQELTQLKARDVSDAAVLVADNSTGEILAYVGNGGAASSARYVDGVRALRQAGSTLKPFLYELAIEQRLLTAASPLDDAPVNLVTATGLYVPQNYDRDFKGWVNLRSALASSLNVPAVKTLLLVGGERFLQRLRTLGFAHLDEGDDFYGPALALGGADVSLWELTQAYRTLANQGRQNPLQMRLVAASALEASPVLDPGAAFIVGDILADRAARSLSFGLENALATRFWSAAKTGTSKDMRDNWCIGFSRRYTVGVWVGNFDGTPMRDVSGVTGAAPIWLAVMNYLNGDSIETALPMPGNVVRASVSYKETSRDELFLAGTESSVTQLKPTQAQKPRIVYPRDGEILSLDPDIPSANQRVIFSAEPTGINLQWRLVNKNIQQQIVNGRWQPQAGRYRLALTNALGEVVDEVGFEMRGSSAVGRVRR